VSTEDLTIDGQVDGSIELGDHDLTIGLDASVTADLRAKVIIIDGAVTGNVDATERVDLRATASVEGNITSPRLAMAGGATVHGKVQTRQKQGDG
jgi:cytoskeletal protein CcmA (bactofilin family)